MQVHYDEGLAIHIGPEPCVGVREDESEASRAPGETARDTSEGIVLCRQRAAWRALCRARVTEELGAGERR